MRRLERSKEARDVRSCRACGLGLACTTREASQGPVPGEGPEDAAVVFVARNPGETEDRENRPLVGKAGAGPFTELLQRLGLRRQDVGLMNVVSCFTSDPANRPPSDLEIATCRVHLVRQLQFFRRRKLVVALGNEALRSFLPTAEGITRMEGRVVDLGNGVKLLPIRHPSAFLRDRSEALRFGALKLPGIVRQVRSILGEGSLGSDRAALEGGVLQASPDAAPVSRRRAAQRAAATRRGSHSDSPGGGPAAPDRTQTHPRRAHLGAAADTSHGRPNRQSTAPEPAGWNPS